jgi:hypothetical protein
MARLAIHQPGQSGADYDDVCITHGATRFILTGSQPENDRQSDQIHGDPVNSGG